MSEKERIPTGLLKTKDELFDFAVDREDIIWLMKSLPEASHINRNTVEYELQLLKIISVGWSITYFLEEDPYKDQIAHLFWTTIREFSSSLSETTGLMIGQDIDYFQLLKDRLEYYVAGLADSDAKDGANLKAGDVDPLTVIGSYFSAKCGNEGDVFTSLTGSKLFMSIITRVREYLDNIDVDPGLDDLNPDANTAV